MEGTPIVDPTDWFNEFESGVPVYEKITFIKKLWSHVMPIHHDTEWLKSFVAEDGIRGFSPFMRQYPELTEALQDCSNPQSINIIIREAQFAMLYNFIGILDQSDVMALFSTNDGAAEKAFGYLQDDLEVLNPDYDEEYDW